MKFETFSNIFMFYADSLHNFINFKHIDKLKDVNFAVNFAIQIREVSTMMRMFTKYNKTVEYINLSKEEEKYITDFLNNDFRNLTENLELIQEDRLKDFLKKTFEITTRRLKIEK